MMTTSAFEVLGPIMVGPSSSHTAGALRIALVARSLGPAPPPLGESMELLGRELALFRLKNALELLEAHNS